MASVQLGTLSRLLTVTRIAPERGVELPCSLMRRVRGVPVPEIPLRPTSAAAPRGGTGAAAARGVEPTEVECEEWLAGTVPTMTSSRGDLDGGSAPTCAELDLAPKRIVRLASWRHGRIE